MYSHFYHILFVSTTVYRYYYANRSNAISFITRQLIHTNKYIELLLSKPTTTNVGVKGDRQVCKDQKRYTHSNVVPKEFSRKKNPECFTSRTFIRLKIFAYKKVTQSMQHSERIQSVLGEIACEENSRGLKTFFLKIYRTVVSDEQKHFERVWCYCNLYI